MRTTIDPHRSGHIVCAILALALATALVAGCQGGSTHGGGPTNLRVAELKEGAQAKLVSADGGDILLDQITAGGGNGKGKGTAKSVKVAKLKLPPGTKVSIQKIVGDDAQIEIQEGPSAGAQCLVECIRLEPA